MTEEEEKAYTFHGGPCGGLTVTTKKKPPPILHITEAGDYRVRLSQEEHAALKCATYGRNVMSCDFNFLYDHQEPWYAGLADKADYTARLAHLAEQLEMQNQLALHLLSAPGFDQAAMDELRRKIGNLYIRELDLLTTWPD